MCDSKLDKAESLQTATNKEQESHTQQTVNRQSTAALEARCQSSLEGCQTPPTQTLKP